MNAKQFIITIALPGTTVAHAAANLKPAKKFELSIHKNQLLPEEIGFAHNKGWCIVQAPSQINTEEDYPITVVYSELMRLSDPQISHPNS